jgi:signal transduction histidine kinase
MTFRNKILISIWGVVLSLLVITFFIINYWTRARIEETSSRELRTGFSSILIHEQLQSAQLIRASTVIAESPRLRAVAELGDAKTAAQLLQELNHTTLSQLYVLTDRHGVPMVQLLGGKGVEWDIARTQTIRSALQFIPSTDVWAFHGAVYRVVSVPVLIANDLVGTLTIGFEITQGDLERLKRATNSEVLLVSSGAPVLSTLDTLEVLSLLPVIAPLKGQTPPSAGDSLETPITLTTSAETYLGSAFRLSNGTGPENSNVFYLITKPLSREVRLAMASILGTFGIISLIFLALTTVIGLVISRGITRPISVLVKGTNEISRGNYDHVIQIGGRDELSMLGDRFMEMSSALKEKISQLDTLNRDLLDRNRDLDETLRKLRSAQEELVRSERLAATGKMTAQLAHEINNPIHNIQSCLKTAMSRLPADIKGRELIDVAYDEVNRLSRLTGQMLNFYRTSLVDDEMVPTDVGELVREVAALSEGELAARKIVVETRIDSGLPLVRGSRDKLKQVLHNLIVNARDAMPEGGHLGLRASTRNGAVIISVKDTGTGISKENLSRIFDAFFTTKGKVSGVGLGLSVSYGIVTQHRGSIEVDSSVGQGSTFTIVLPQGA